MTRKVVSIEKSISFNEIFNFWHPKNYFPEMFHESLEKQFSWNV